MIGTLSEFLQNEEYRPRFSHLYVLGFGVSSESLVRDCSLKNVYDIVFFVYSKLILKNNANLQEDFFKLL